MVAITDKFGRASSSSSYAKPTTVKNARAALTTTLDCVDLSSFTDTTPAYFVTYTKTTDPVTGAITKTNQLGGKGIVNTVSNSITNIVIDPGYTDTGNNIGDYVECIPTSNWANDLVDGIRAEHKDNGKHGAVTADSVTINASGSLTIPSSGTFIGNGKVGVEARSGGFKVGVIPGSTFSTTGNKSITGVGFKPKLIKFRYLTAASSGNTSSASGATDGTTSYAESSAIGIVSTTAAYRSSWTDRCMQYADKNGTLFGGASIVSLGSDGFTINVLNTGAFDVAYEAYA